MLAVVLLAVGVAADLKVPQVSDAVCQLSWLAPSSECKTVEANRVIAERLIAVWRDPSRVPGDIDETTEQVANVSGAMRQYINARSHDMLTETREVLLREMSKSGEVTAEFHFNRALTRLAKEVKRIQYVLAVDEKASLELQRSAIQQQLQTSAVARLPVQDRLGHLRPLLKGLEEAGRSEEQRHDTPELAMYRSELNLKLALLALCHVSDVPKNRKLILDLFVLLTEKGIVGGQMLQVTGGAEAAFEARVQPEVRSGTDLPTFLSQSARLRQRIAQLSVQLAALEAAHLQVLALHASPPNELPSSILS